ncbi:MAG: acyl-CoA desaturase [Leptospiraceae bacterium]|nr:acyl-CoA desaturase [Leptospiraceae bacterium]
MEAILIFFFGHWFASAFAQSFFLHRYASHAMFTMNKFWEKFWHLFTVIAQGPSFLHPRGYATLHRMHHQFSDTEKDPHSPHHAKNFFHMMLKTKEIYDGYAYNRVKVSAEYIENTPFWPAIDRLSQSWIFRILSGSLYAFYYMYFVPADMLYLYLLLPVHWLMGPIHGAMVNWGGHMYGYVNFKKTKDESRNTLPIDFLIGGELYQNNHHAFGTAPNFAKKWFELDTTYQVMKLLHMLHIIRLKKTEPVKEVVMTGETVNA